MKKYISMYESEMYNNDNEDFEDEDSKSEYYDGDFWIHSDFISFDNDGCRQDILCNCIGDEIFIYDCYGEISYSEEIIEMVERFYNDDYEEHYTALMVGTNISHKDDENYKPELPRMWYRGGKGYYYYCFQYNYNVEFEPVEY